MASSTDGFQLISGECIELKDHLGGGGFGDVYQAIHADWGSVAVKQISLKHIKRAERGPIRRYELKEARKMWRAISSPYIVRVMGVIQEPDDAEILSIVMEYFENGSLKDFEQKYMKCECWARKVKMIQDIARGMNYLHTLKPPIIHRDLKLENVFVGEGFEAKIGDLGLAVSSKASLEQAGVAGTRSHIPPEASSSTATEPDEFWDIYTFAITVFELVSGNDAWPQQQRFANDALVAVWVLKGHRPELKAIPSEAPAEIVEIITKCWVAEPKERPTFRDILKSVSELFDGKYKAGIRNADRAIFQQMDQESVEIKKQGSSAVDSGVDSICSNVDSMDIHEASNSGTTSTDSGKGISTDLQPKPPQAHSMKEWRLVREFSREGDGEGEFRRAHGIAICHNGDIGVTNVNIEKNCTQLYMFNSDGTYKSTLKSHTTNPTGKLKYPWDVAVTSQGHLVVADVSEYLKVYDVNGSFLHSFCTLTPDENSNTKVITVSVAVTPQDDIIIGDDERQLVTIHTQTDGWTPRKVTLPIKPNFLATNSQRHILVSGKRKVIALSFEGIVLFTIARFRVDGETGSPQGIVCDSNGDVYIGVMRYNESDNTVILGTGHIHQYDNTGVFLRCIAKGLYRPYGITMSNGSLYVGNEKSVLIHSTQ